MKATLQFDLPEENDEFTLAIKGKKYWNAIYDFEDVLRKWWKYDDSIFKKFKDGKLVVLGKDEEGYEIHETKPIEEIIDIIRDRFYEVLNDNDVSTLDI